MRLKNIQQALIGRWISILTVFFIFCFGHIHGQTNSQFESFKGEKVSIITTEMIPTSVILWDENLSEKEEFVALNHSVQQLLKSLTGNSSIKNLKDYLLPVVGGENTTILFVNGIDSIAPIYALRNDQLLANKYLLRSKFMVEGQAEKDMITCFTLVNNKAPIIKLDKGIRTNDFWE